MWSCPHLLALRTRNDPAGGLLWGGLELASRGAVGRQKSLRCGQVEGGILGATDCHSCSSRQSRFGASHSKLHLQMGWASLCDHRRTGNTAPAREETHTMASAGKDSGLIHRRGWAPDEDKAQLPNPIQANCPHSP